MKSPDYGTFSRPGGHPEDVLSEFTPLRRLINQGGFGLLHFACHNSFSPAGGSSISLGNRPFAVTNLQSARINRSLLSSTPVIFLNACRTAGLAATYNGLDGWAEAFMQAGAGAFVGSLWAVTDGAAREFAQEFYHQLRKRAPAGRGRHRGPRVRGQPARRSHLARLHRLR